MSNVIQLFTKKEPQPTRPDWWLCNVPNIVALAAHTKSRPALCLIKRD